MSWLTPSPRTTASHPPTIRTKTSGMRAISGLSRIALPGSRAMSLRTSAAFTSFPSRLGEGLRPLDDRRRVEPVDLGDQRVRVEAVDFHLLLHQARGQQVLLELLQLRSEEH